LTYDTDYILPLYVSLRLSQSRLPVGSEHGLVVYSDSKRSKTAS